MAPKEPNLKSTRHPSPVSRRHMFQPFVPLPLSAEGDDAADAADDVADIAGERRKAVEDWWRRKSCKPKAPGGGGGGKGGNGMWKRRFICTCGLVINLCDSDNKGDCKGGSDSRGAKFSKSLTAVAAAVRKARRATEVAEELQEREEKRCRSENAASVL